MNTLLTQLSWFVIVGCSAAATHWAVAVLCVELLGLAPLLANVAGWLVAFNVSLFGHYHLTFKHQHAPWKQAALRFFGVALLGFILNELAYALLLHTTGLRYDVALAVVLVGVAALTFLLSRFWAFRRLPPKPASPH
ncbi:GtrA family protein [Pusillimonas sp. CC-YST705]|uniref:GtrA family protein n=1 Tax=Mesopusillimonas faecipullorum TaxID=2755040 RepID=A0ABS8CCE7_9BURK|nr:GtrA family protein [Mesopusillimonas faecipullorum]MCB5363514.1 GtrA family protein [Mesopusillimonas faecipullorum]